MIRDLLRREFVQEKVKVLADLTKNAQQRMASDDRGMTTLADENQVTLDEMKDAQHILATLKETMPAGDEDPEIWVPRERYSSIIQSALEQFYRGQPGAIATSNSQGLVGGADPVSDESLELAHDPLVKTDKLMDQFSLSDPRWAAAFTAAKVLAKARGQHPFPTNRAPTVPMANKARVIIMGDWASGLPRAQKVAQQIRVALDDADAASMQKHVIHLGDVYYAGFEHEYDERFLPFWPVRANEASSIGSWALNGNHEMFTGGAAYFDHLLENPLFACQTGSSYFLLENDNWQIFGLDSAYDQQGLRGDQGDLYGDQAAWLAFKRAAAPQKKTILITHHQLFSAYETDSPRMEARIWPVLPVTAWFWGHEHRCVFYEPNTRVRYARLIGHGGIPEKKGGKQADPARAKVLYEYQDSFQYGMKRLLYFGFCVLDFDGAQVQARYINEDGKEHRRERIS